jgi:integrase
MNLSIAIERLRDVLRRQHKALATESSYVYWLRHYVTALNTMAATLSSEQKLERFLTDLARHRDLSASSQNQALNAVLFFYKEVLRQPLQGVDALRAKRPARLRHAPTVPETQALLQTIRDQAGYPTNLIARMIYGCGLRVTEPLNMRIKDVNLEQLTLFLVGAKGGKDRVVSLPKSLVPELVQQMKFAQAVWQRDQQNKIPVTLPHQLAIKYPDYQFSWPWAWLFPSHHTCFHPRTRCEVRYRMHEANVQRAVFRTNSAMVTPRTAWKTGSVRVPSNWRWAIVRSKPPWATSTPKV